MYVCMYVCMHVYLYTVYVYVCMCVCVGVHDRSPEHGVQSGPEPPHHGVVLQHQGTHGVRATQQ